MKGKKPRKYDAHGVIVWMCEVDGWIMARRPHAMPFTVDRKTWDRMSDVPTHDSRIHVMGSFYAE